MSIARLARPCTQPGWFDSLIKRVLVAVPTAVALVEAGAGSLGLLSGHPAVAVSVETTKQVGARGGEFFARELTVAVPIVAPTAGLPALFVARVHLRPLLSRDRAVIVGVEPREHAQRAGQEFVTRNGAVIVGIGFRPMLAMAAHSTAMAPPVFATFQLPVIILVEPRKSSGAGCIELRATDHAVSIGVSLEEVFDAASVMALRQRRSGKHRRACRREKDDPHETYSKKSQ